MQMGRKLLSERVCVSALTFRAIIMLSANPLTRLQLCMCTLDVRTYYHYHTANDFTGTKRWLKESVLSRVIYLLASAKMETFSTYFLFFCTKVRIFTGFSCLMHGISRLQDLIEQCKSSGSTGILKMIETKKEKEKSKSC